MQNATAVALSRLVAQQRAIDVTAANLANSATPGYRGEHMVFSDWLAKQPMQGQPPGAGTVTFPQDRATYRDTRQGPISHTGNPLDLAITADGFFTVQTGAGPRLTRAGHFELSSTGGIVDGAGNALLDSGGKPLQVSPTDTRLTIAADGTLSSENGQIGKVGVVQPTNPNLMQAEGSRLFNAGGPTTAVAAPKLVQGAIEDSNIQPTLEVTRMLNEVREFQFVTQFLQGESDREQGAIDKIVAKHG